MAQYPKPLSKKTLEKEYRKYSEEKVNFLRDFFTVCSNLYGGIFMADAIYVYEEIKNKNIDAQGEIIQISHRDIIEITKIFRRDDSVPFFVFDQNEVYLEEPKDDYFIVVVDKELIGYGYGKFIKLHDIFDRVVDKPFFIPDDFILWTEKHYTKYDKKLIEYLGDLAVTRDKSKDKYNKEIDTSIYKGKLLRHFSYISEVECNNLKEAKGEMESYSSTPEKTVYYKGNKRIYEYLLKEYNYPYNEKLVRKIKRRADGFEFGLKDIFPDFVMMIQEVGVVLTQEQAQKIVKLLEDVINNMRMRHNRGYTPNEMATISRHTLEGATVVMGPHMKRKIANGELDKNTLEKIFAEKGMTLVDSDKNDIDPNNEKMSIRKHLDKLMFSKEMEDYEKMYDNVMCNDDNEDIKYNFLKTYNDIVKLKCREYCMRNKIKPEYADIMFECYMEYTDDEYDNIYPEYVC